MVWPNEINFIFTSNNKPVKNLLVYFILLANKKNNYTIGPLKTDEKGAIKITRLIMVDTIKNEMTNYPMDYSSPLEDCKGIELLVETLNELKKEVKQLSEFYPQEANKLESLILTCSNFNYTGMHVTYEMPLNQEPIQIELEKV